MLGKLDRRHVLRADDYSGMHSALTRLLAPWCDVVGGIDDAARLLDAIARLRPDVVVLDLSMPGVDGLQACRQIKSVNPDVNVIVCTAADEPWLATKAVEAGASAFVLKCRIGDDLVSLSQSVVSAQICRWPIGAPSIASASTSWQVSAMPSRSACTESSRKRSTTSSNKALRFDKR